jgi:hypothetical protein
MLVVWLFNNNQDVSEYTSRLSGLELAKYVLLRLVNDHDTIEKIAEDFENDKRFTLGVVDFLTDIGWIEQDSGGIYKITRKGEKNTITRQRPSVSFRYGDTRTYKSNKKIEV